MTKELEEKLKKAGFRKVQNINNTVGMGVSEGMSKENAPKKLIKPKKTQIKRPPSGESILIEIMTDGALHTKEELKNETGLAESSIKMYCNGYLERVRHKPYHIVEGLKDSMQAFKLEIINVKK